MIVIYECILILQDLERFLCVSTNNSIENILIFQNYIYFFSLCISETFIESGRGLFFHFYS
jgi:hypothetical protein